MHHSAAVCVLAFLVCHPKFLLLFTWFAKPQALPIQYGKLLRPLKTYIYIYTPNLAEAAAILYGKRLVPLKCKPFHTLEGQHANHCRVSKVFLKRMILLKIFSLGNL